MAEKRYDEYVGSFPASVGEAYGMRMLGEYANGPKLYSAIPDGDEIWAATRLGSCSDVVTFLGTDRRRRKGSPDLLLGDGTYADTESPTSRKRVAARLAEANKQCRSRGKRGGAAVPSALRLDDGQEAALRVSKDCVRRESISRVYLVGPDSTVELIE